MDHGAYEPERPDDAFPTQRFTTLLKRLPRYARLSWGLAGEPRLSRSRRAALLGAAAYLVSPVDLVPGIVPVVGQVDDIAIALLALRAALRALDEPTRMRQLAAAGLQPGDLDEDTRTLGLVALWLGRRGVRLGRRLLALAAVAAGHAARAGGRLALRAGEAGARTSASAGGRAVRATGQRVRDSAVAGGSAARSAAAGLGRRITRRGRPDPGPTERAD